MEIQDQKRLKILLLIQLTYWIRGTIIAPVFSLYIHEKGISVTQIGFLMMIQALGWAIFEPTFGILADIINKKKLIIFSVIATSIVYVSYTFANNIWQFYLVVFAMSSASSAGAVSSRAMLTEFLPLKNRGRVYGRYMAILSMGGVLGPIIGGFLAENIGFKAPFFLSGGIGIICLFILTFLKYDETPKGKIRFSLDSLMTMGRASLGPIKRPLLVILLIRLLYMFNMHFRRSILPIMLNDSPSFRASETQIGVFFGIIMFSSALAQIFLGNLSDKIGSKKLLVIGLIAGGISYQSMNIFQDLTLLYLTGLFQGIFFAACRLSMMIIFMNIIPVGSSGKAMGIYGLSEDLGGMISSPLLGLIYDLKGSVFSVNFISGVLITVAILSIFLVKEEATRADEPAHK